MGPKERKKHFLSATSTEDAELVWRNLFFPRKEMTLLHLPFLESLHLSASNFHRLPVDSSVEAAVVGNNSKGNTEELHGSGAVNQKHSSSWEHLGDVPSLGS